MRSTYLAPIIVLSLTLFKENLANADNGYHYERPAQTISNLNHNAGNNGGHYFAPIPTISPLPAVPALPPLPTANSGSHVHTHTIVQHHPPQQTASKSIANAYRPPSAAPLIPKSYLPATLQQTGYQRPASSGYAVLTPPNAPSAPNFKPNIRSAQIGTQPQARTVIYGQRVQTASLPAYVPSSSYPSGPAAAQPLRIPYGQQAIIHLPKANPDIGDVYNVGNRQVKQYAVFEIIDNDIEQDTRPFLKAPFIDNNRAQIGASGTGAVAPVPGQQLASRSSALAQAQQNLAQQRANNDAIALGSGGLGFVRLPNGNVYLGSGSLGYISGQQHSALVHEARTRTGAAVPDALHFGHGALGDLSVGRRFRF